MKITYIWGPWDRVFYRRPPGNAMRRICEAVGRRYGVTVEELRGRDRLKLIVDARQEAMWLCRQERWPDGSAVFSYPAIGRWFGSRDHTTVMMACRRHELRSERNRLAA
jgi:chromosomal replication initiator protein